MGKKYSFERKLVKSLFLVYRAYRLSKKIVNAAKFLLSVYRSFNRMLTKFAFCVFSIWMWLLILCLWWLIFYAPAIQISINIAINRA